MALDASIILGGKPVQLDNPADVYTKALNMKQLAQTAQVRDQEIAANAAMKNAYNKNTTIGPGGSPVLDQNGTMADLANNGYGKQALDLKSQFTTNNLAQQQAQMKGLSDQIGFVHSSLGTVNDQATYDQHRARMIQAGVPNAATSPTAYDPSWVAKAFEATEDAKTKLEQHNKITDQTTERAKANASLAESGLPILPAVGESPNQSPGGQPSPASPAGAPGFTPPPKMRQKAMDDYTNSVAGSRQQPDALQALKDIQAGQKLNEIAGLAPGGDLNKLNNQQTKLAITELVKMAGGSVPTEGELEQMSPDNYAQKYSGLLQKLTNSSQPANAGEFIQQGIDYAKGIQKLGAQKLADRSNELAERQKPYFGDHQYKMIKGQISDEFNRNSPQAVDKTKDSPGKKVMSFEDWRTSQAGGKK